MKPENSFLDPALEQAMSEIREEAVDPAVIESAAARVWARLAEAGAAHPHIRTCADFQSLIPDYRANRLPEARAFLLKDHLNECVACRRVFEGRVFTLPAQRIPSRRSPAIRWAAAAAVFAAAGLSVWVAVDRFGTHTGHAVVQSIDGTLYAVSADGIRALAVGQGLPNGAEFRTAKDSSAMLQLRDGSVVELRERSGLTASETPADLTIHLIRGSLIVQAAKRSTGHLYVVTADARVAVTGTIFGVSSGVKGSRVSVIQGEVHVEQDNRDKVLHPGDQTVTSPDIEPESVRDDIGWSRNHDHYYALLAQLAALRSSLNQLQLPGLRYSSRLLGRLPASTVFYASIPNLSQYLGESEKLFNQKMAESPEVRQFLSGGGFKLEPLIEKVRAGSEYLGDEIAIVGIADASGNVPSPVCFAEVKREGFDDFLNKEFHMPPGHGLPIEIRNGFAVFGPNREAVGQLSAALDSPSGGFEKTPFYARIADSYRHGAGLLLTADLSRLMNGKANRLAPSAEFPDVQYLVAEQKQAGHDSGNAVGNAAGNAMESRASFYFNGPRTGIAAWLANPAPMGALDFISPEATVVAAFVVKDPTAILDQAGALTNAPAAQLTASLKDLAASLGGEFALSLDGPVFPVPSLKLVIEVYDSNHAQAALQKLVENVNAAGPITGDKPLRTSQETVSGRTYYMIAGGDPNPLTEFHYTFADGYLIAAPSLALLEHALQVRNSGASIMRSSKFMSMLPRDHHTNVSAVVYQNLGKSLAPVASLLGALSAMHGGNGPGNGADNNPSARPNRMPDLANLGSNLLAVYGEPDHITVAANGDIIGNSVANLMSGDVMSIAGGMLPVGQLFGTRTHQPAYR